MADNYPTASDLQSFLEGAGIVVGSAIKLQLDSVIRGAIKDFERECNRKFLAGSASTRKLDPPTNTDTLVLDRDLATLVSFTYAPSGATPTVWVEGTDFKAYPLNAVADEIPYTYIEINRLAWEHPLNIVYKGSIQINGRWGYSLSVPDDVWMGMVLLGAVTSICMAASITTSGVRFKRVEDYEVEYGSGAYSQQISLWSKQVRSVINNYRRLV